MLRQIAQALANLRVLVEEPAYLGDRVHVAAVGLLQHRIQPKPVLGIRRAIFHRVTDDVASILHRAELLTDVSIVYAGAVVPTHRSTVWGQTSTLEFWSLW